MARSPAGALLAVRRCTPHAAACRARLAGALRIVFTSSRGQPEHLYEVAVRVAAVEGHRPVTVLPWLPRDRHAARAQTLGGGVDLRRRVDHEAEMIERAAGGHVVGLVERQVVRARAQVDVLRVGSPDLVQPEVLAVERGGGAHVAHAEREVPQPAYPDRRVGHRRLLLGGAPTGNGSYRP